jgi:rhamnosyl/mannosyltransferase
MLNVLCVGRLTHYKGQSVLLQAVAEAIKRGGAIRLVLVGSGELRAELEQQVCALGLQDSVVFAGQVDEDTLTDLYSNCDLLCLPSLERTEAFGMVLLEAMNFARPTLVTDVPGSGMSWVVRDGETGWVVKAGDASSLAERLLWCANHCEALSAAGEAGQRRAREHFSVDRVAEDTLALYREVVGQ